MEIAPNLPVKGRGTSHNPGNRFETIRYERDLDDPVDECPAPTTQFFKDATRSIIARNDSPDIPFDASLNPYRGCEHGCVYCYARPFHEYLGFSAGLDFETKILVKEDAPELLRKELSSASWKPQFLAISGVTDAYQPIERKLQITRRCLEVLVEFRNPVGVITKNHLVTRDIDLLGELARHQAACVYLGLTTLDASLARTMEPRATHPAGRLEAMRELSQAGIPVGAMLAPIIPGLTDHEIPQLLEAAHAAGARHAGYVILRLPNAVNELFVRWLEQHFPLKKERVLSRIRAMRGGKQNDARFGKRMHGEGPFADLIEQVFTKMCRKLGMNSERQTLSTASFRRPQETPTLLFEEA